MRFRDISSIAVFFIIGIFMVAKLGGQSRIMGLLFIATGVVFLIITLKENGIIKKRVKESDEDEIDERDAEIIRQAEEVEKLEEYDSDSGKGYCSYCGNYSVNSEKICESCGEKAID